MKSEIIIFYDGICILCSNAMNFIQRNDKKNSFLLSPLQSSYAQRTIDPKFIRDMDTVIVFSLILSMILLQKEDIAGLEKKKNVFFQ